MFYSAKNQALNISFLTKNTLSAIKNTETLLIECLKTVGNKISNCEYLRGLLKDGKKFEGWFQIELACELHKTLKESVTYKVVVEKRVGKKRYADLLIERDGEKDIEIEIKFIVKGKAITDARKSLLDQMHQNSKTPQSYGIALLASKTDTSWCKKEIERIEAYCKQKQYAIKIDSTDYKDNVFCIKLLRHERIDGKS